MVMPVARRPSAMRLGGPLDVGELVSLAALENPFTEREEVVGRELVSDRIGLIVAEQGGVATLLYLWTHAIEDLSPWMAHASQWLLLYPVWRRAQGLAPSAAPVRVVLAAPDIGPAARLALRLVSCRVTTSRYAVVDLGGRSSLGWEMESGETVDGENLAADRRLEGSVQRDLGDELTPEELAFFRHR